MSVRRDRVESLIRRRDFLARQLGDAAKGAELTFIRGELAGLNMALQVIENAHSLGVLGLLASVDPVAIHITDRLARGQSLAEIARVMRLSPRDLDRHVDHLCKLYLCERDELAAAVTAARCAA